jgi:hypothetical protein
MKDRRSAGQTFILPMTTVIETGNHIAHVADGRERRTAAEVFSKMLDLVIAENAPWRLHQFQWGGDFLATLNRGANTSADLIEHATAGLGVGDLCILAEREEYRKRAKLHSVEIWSIDGPLLAHN